MSTPDLLSSGTSKRNFYSLLWHAGFLAFAQNFMDVDTVVPAMLVEAGGNAVHIGLMTAIMLGGASFTQLIFAPFISNFHYKKRFLLIGINSRVLSLLGLGVMLYLSSKSLQTNTIWLIFIFLTLFSLGGAFSNISYTDILGKSIMIQSRKPFLTLKQIITGIILLFGALLAKKILVISEYPLNYSWLFFIAFAGLLIASMGFWNLKEVVPSKLLIKNPLHFINLLKTEISQNRKLVYFLGFINTMGISIAFLPFVILYAKDLYHTQSSETGFFLLYKVIGSVSAAFLLIFFAGRYKYSYLLYGGAFMALMLPLLITAFAPLFSLVFITGGIVFTAYVISMNGVLLEISSVENRTLYTGIAGAGNIIPAIFPLIGGWIIKHYGFQPFFILFMILILCSFYFIYKINCRK